MKYPIAKRLRRKSIAAPVARQTLWATWAGAAANVFVGVTALAVAFGQYSIQKRTDDRVERYDQQFVLSSMKNVYGLAKLRRDFPSLEQMRSDPDVVEAMVDQRIEEWTILRSHMSSLSQSIAGETDNAAYLIKADSIAAQELEMLEADKGVMATMRSVRARTPSWLKITDPNGPHQRMHLAMSALALKQHIDRMTGKNGGWRLAAWGPVDCDHGPPLSESCRNVGISEGWFPPR